MSNATIAYLGPQGTYSDEAARLFAKKMGCENPEFVECPSFNEVHEAVDRGRCEFGVMPIENSLEGVVTATLDTLAFKGGVSIMGSTVLNIHHCLMVNPESTLDKVTTIASHPQALAQCRRWLNAHWPFRPLRKVRAKQLRTKRWREFPANLQDSCSTAPLPKKALKITTATRRALCSLPAKATNQCSRATT